MRALKTFPVFLQGVLHTVSGYMLYTATTFKLVFDHQHDDVYWCTADIGWITGHSYITYGPLANGATSVLVSDRWFSPFRKAAFTCTLDTSAAKLPDCLPDNPFTGLYDEQRYSVCERKGCCHSDRLFVARLCA